jgi:hypothetical protein
MKRILPVLLLFPVILSAQSQRQTTYTTVPDCYVQGFTPLAGGGNVLCGYSKYGTDSCLINLIFMNDSDVTVSHKEFNTATDFDFASCILPTGNGFLIGGKSSDPSFFHPELIKTDLNGNVQWAKYFDNTSSWQGQIIRIIPNGNNFSMYTYAETPFNDFYRIESDGSGSSFTGFQYTPDTAMSFRIFDAEKMSNSASHILCGHANFNSSTTRGGLLMKTNQAGVQWCRHITAGGNFKNDIIDVTTAADGNSYSVFVCENLPGNQYSTVILKFDSLGNKVWAKQLALSSGSLNGCSIIESAAHDFYVASYDNLFVAYISKIDAAGNLVWTHKWSVSTSLGASAMKLFKDSNGNIVLTGMLDNSYFVARLDANAGGCGFTTTSVISATNASTVLTNIPFTTTVFTPTTVNETTVYSHLGYTENMLCGGVGIEEASNNNLVSVYPNPAENILFIQSDLEIRSVEITDLSGKRMLQKFGGVISEMQLDINGLASGIYILKVTGEENVSYKKFVKE